MNSKQRNVRRIIASTGVAVVMGLFLPVLPLAYAQPDDSSALERPVDEMRESGKNPRKQMRRRMMERTQEGMGPHGERDGKEGRMRRMGSFISFMSTFFESVKDPHQAAGLAALSIKDSYKKQGKPLEAVKVLEEAMASTKDQAMRNVLLFSMRQIFEENDQPDKVLEISQRILKENLTTK